MPQDLVARHIRCSQVGECWRWCVYDEDGVTVADGAHESRDAAEEAVASTLRSAPGQASAFG